MAKIKFSKRKAAAISNGVFLIALALLFFLNYWWPGILLAIWLLLGTREYLTGRYYDFAISTFIFIGLFIASFFKFRWDVFVPVLLVLGGIYLIFKEVYYSRDTNGEDVAQEIKDDSDIS